MSVKPGAALAVAVVVTAIVAFAYDGGPTPPAAVSPEAGSEAVSAPSPMPDTRLPPGHPPVAGAPPPSPTGLPPGHPPMGADAPGVGLPPGHPPMGAPGGVGAPVAPLADGVTVAQLFAQTDLAGTRVRLAARVTKVTPNVLGRTWLHVEDGTGRPAEGNHDLVVTTEAQPAVGDVVVLEGMVTRDKDLGSGYRYDVLLEDATVSPQSEAKGEPSP